MRGWGWPASLWRATQARLRLGDGPAERTGDFAASMSFGHPPGEVVDEGAYTYTAPSSTPSYMLIFAKRENNGGRDSGLAEDRHPTESHPGDILSVFDLFSRPAKITGCPFFAEDSKKYGEVLLPLPRLIGVGLRLVASPDTSVFAYWLRPDTSGSRDVSSLSPERERVG